MSRMLTFYFFAFRCEIGRIYSFLGSAFFLEDYLEDRLLEEDLSDLCGELWFGDVSTPF
jgi:hypothetical protein